MVAVGGGGGADMLAKHEGRDDELSFLGCCLDPGPGLTLVVVTGLHALHLPALPALHQLGVGFAAHSHRPRQVTGLRLQHPG